MTTIAILYPNAPGARFDMDYYVKTHMPRSIALLSAHPGFRAVSVEKGVGGAQPGSPPAHAAICLNTTTDGIFHPLTRGIETVYLLINGLRIRPPQKRLEQGEARDRFRRGASSVG